MTEPVIQLQQIDKAFGSQSVLENVNLSIERGLVTSVIGKSGVGKSVMLKLIIGLLQPDGGEILFEGQALQRMTRAAKRNFKAKCSYMFQSMALFDSLTIYENIAMPLEEKSRLSNKEIGRRVGEKIEQLELGEIAEKHPSQISGGMKKRVALARALIIQPEIILFDEPTTGLDPVRKNSVYQMIQQYQQQFNFTAVVVSHEIPDIFTISQKVAMLDERRIVFEGEPAEIVKSTDPLVQRFIKGESPASPVTIDDFKV